MIDDTVVKDRELQEVVDFMNGEEFVTRAELGFQLEIIQDTLNEIKQEIQDLRNDIAEFRKEMQELKQKNNTVDAVVDNDKIKIEYFSNIRKNFTEFKR